MMTLKMVSFEHRAFMHDTTYQAIADSEQDQHADGVEQYGETDVSELASYHHHHHHHHQLDEREILGHDEGRPMMTTTGEEAAVAAAAAAAIQGAKMADMAPTPPPPMALPSSSLVPESSRAEKSSPAPTSSQGRSDAADSAQATSTPARMKLIPKPDREVSKHPDGKFYCTWSGCTEAAQGFNRRCEWSKHMDKHERPYRCDQQGCEKLPGFTYSGGLLRHQREVHGKHGGPKNTFNCPHTNCKRHAGKGFSRQENLNEHLRRVHTEGPTSPTAMAAAVAAGHHHHGTDDGASGHGGAHLSDTDSEKAALLNGPVNVVVTGKRKRSSLDDPTDHRTIDNALAAAAVVVDDDDADELDVDVREEFKRLRRENDQLREELRQHREEQLSMVAQIADLQAALRISSATMASPTSMI